MIEKIKDILEKHYYGRNVIEDRCAKELLDLFLVSKREPRKIIHPKTQCMVCEDYGYTVKDGKKDKDCPYCVKK